MAQILNEPKEATEEDVTSLDELAEQTQETETQEAQGAQQDTDSELPEKYRGKSLQDIIRMHQEAESFVGKQSNEIGELRKAVDQMIQMQMGQSDTKEDDTEVDFFEDPKKAVTKAIESHPKFRELDSLTEQQSKAQRVLEIQRLHPDMETIIQDPQFIEWVSSNQRRAAKLAKAHHNFDVEAADELFSDWKERQALTQQTMSTEKQARKQAVTKASTGATGGSAERPTKKIYRREDIVDLMRKDPERYEALMPEIRRAYAERRVR